MNQVLLFFMYIFACIWIRGFVFARIASIAVSFRSLYI